MQPNDAFLNQIRDECTDLLSQTGRNTALVLSSERRHENSDRGLTVSGRENDLVPLLHRDYARRS